MTIQNFLDRFIPKYQQMPETEDLVNDFDTADIEAAIASAQENRVVDDAPVETATEVAAEQTIDQAAEAATTPPEATTTTTDAPNYTKYFEELSGGKVKGDDDFKAVLKRAEERDTLEAELTETKAKVLIFKNDESKALYEAFINGNEDTVRNYLSEKSKDYKVMSDTDIMREALAHKNPNWSKAEVELELRYSYGENLEKVDVPDKDDEPAEYAEAMRHNKEVDQNLMKLQRDARDNRPILLEAQSKIELPKITQAATPVSTEPTEQEIAEGRSKWVNDVKAEMPKLPNIKMTIDDKEVEYVSTDDDKGKLSGYMEKFNIIGFAKDRGWYKEDGSPNHVKIAEDVQKLQDFEKITKSFATQVKTTTTKDVMGKIKNINNDYRAPEDNGEPNSLEEAAEQAKARAKSA